MGVVRLADARRMVQAAPDAWPSRPLIPDSNRESSPTPPSLRLRETGLFGRR
jgi:hypothetical protein